MRYYGISESLIKRIIRFPKRKEEGIAEETTAVMSPYGRSPKGRQQPYAGEIWVMYQEVKNVKREMKSDEKQTDILRFSLDALRSNKVRIISAWRYPGISPVGKKIVIPDEVMTDLAEALQE